MTTLTTGDLADRAGVNPQTLRYYERRGLLPEPPRLPSGYRLYDETHVTRVRFIKRAQELGFQLTEIEELLALRADPAGDRGAVRDRTVDKIADIEARIRDLTRMRDTLRALTEACDGHGSLRECPILEALDAPSSTETRPEAP